MALNFDKYVNYDHDTSPFESVIFGSGGTVLEVELNEMQDILLTKLKTIVKDVIGNVITNVSNITFSNSQLLINNSIICVNGYIIKCNNITISASINDNIYVNILEETVTKDSELKKNGYINGSSITNTIKDSRYSNETTRRKSIKYSIGTSELSGYTNVLIGKVTSNGLDIEIISTDSKANIDGTTFTTPTTLSRLTNGDKLSEIIGYLDKCIQDVLILNNHASNTSIHLSSSDILKLSNLPNNVNTELNKKVNKSTVISKTLSASSWSNNIIVVNSESIIDDNQIIELTVPNTITKDQLEALQAANIQHYSQNIGSVTIKAWGDIPSIDIPVILVIRNDV